MEHVERAAVKCVVVGDGATGKTVACIRFMVNPRANQKYQTVRGD